MIFFLILLPHAVRTPCPYDKNTSLFENGLRFSQSKPCAKTACRFLKAIRHAVPLPGTPWVRGRIAQSNPTKTLILRIFAERLAVQKSREQLAMATDCLAVRGESKIDKCNTTNAVEAKIVAHSPFPMDIPAMATDSLHCNKNIALVFSSEYLGKFTQPLFILRKIGYSR
jgi:hypothetical protein